MVKFAKTGGRLTLLQSELREQALKRIKLRSVVIMVGMIGIYQLNINDKKKFRYSSLTGLSTSGIPKNLKNTVFPFEYNNFNQLVKICKKHDIGTIKMEVFRNIPPKIIFYIKLEN